MPYIWHVTSYFGDRLRLVAAPVTSFEGIDLAARCDNKANVGNLIYEDRISTDQYISLTWEQLINCSLFWELLID